MKHIQLYPDISLSFIGPDLHEGPLPALFYLALSAHETLTQDPYDQPALYLSSLPIRIFSLDLPGHGKNLPSKEALKKWSASFTEGNDIITSCAEQVSFIIDDLIQKDIIDSDKVAVMGLSRGVLIATHVAARNRKVRWLLGFAPLTKLSFAHEFHIFHDDPRITKLNIENLTHLLKERHVRFYIGNHDTRVGTRHCYDFIEKLSQENFDSGIRSPTVDLIITPSIGFKGHGTSKQAFHHGAQWLAEQLGIIDVR